MHGFPPPSENYHQAQSLSPDVPNTLDQENSGVNGLSSRSSSYLHNYSGAHPYPTEPSPLLPYNYEWFTGITQSMPSAPIASSYPMHPSVTSMPRPPPVISQSMAGPSQPVSPPRTSQNIHTPEDPEKKGEATFVGEDKRRRVTAASARFRLKKKMKALTLERTIEDLTGRTGELEREATDLRRENAWLKEIVLLKARTLAARNLGSSAAATTSKHNEEANDDGCSDSETSDPPEQLKETGKEQES